MTSPPHWHTPDEFLSGAARKREAARRLLDDRELCVEAYMNVGYAVEYTLKALILAKERPNSFPENLKTHNLADLFRRLGVDKLALPPHLRASMKVLLQWNRLDDYVYNRIPRRRARQMFDAAFDPQKGVLPWLAP